MNKIIEKDKKYLIQCYTTDDIAFTNAKGMYLYDSEGKKYLVFRASSQPAVWDTAMRN